MFGKNKGVPKKIIITFITNIGQNKVITYPRKRFEETFGMRNPTDAILMGYCENILENFPNIIDYEVRKE